MKTDKLIEIRNGIRALSDDLRKLKDDNYSELYRDGDLKYFEEIQRSLSISAANVATFIDHLENMQRYTTTKDTSTGSV